MDLSIIIDIANFILMILLMDFFNGIHNNYLAKKLKSGIAVIIIFFLSAFALCFLTHFFIPAKIALLVIEVLMILSVFITKSQIKKSIQYSDVEAGKENIFGSQTVMFLVPHEDDDINLAGGVIEEYIKHGSTVYVVFSTNGDGDERFDMSKMSAIRINEAIRALAVLGVPESNIIFLGYGDGWVKNGPHIYNAPRDEVMTSMAGKQATYGIELHPAYHDHNSFTYNHYYDDIKSVILEYLPDTIFCIDYDTHNDHRALSMLFEKVMGDILKTTDYNPNVYKGYGYRTAWGSAPDFNQYVNISSSVSAPADRDVKIYDWDKRVRFPIDIISVSRKLNRSKLYTALSQYASQHAVESADRIINGDKVFWKRRTDSILYKAEISVSSGDKGKLTDFMLLDCDDLINNGDHPYDGVWRPDSDDPEKMINVVFGKPTYIDHIVLYDSPLPKDNILNTIVELDDGTRILTGKLKPSGTSIPIKKSIRSFAIQIEEFEGDYFGLTEIEVFTNENIADRPLFKIIDKEDNFVYDYIVASDGKEVFGIYTNTNCSTNAEDYHWKCSKKVCTVETKGENIILYCPRGQKCLLSLLDKSDRVLDTVLIRNPRKISRIMFEYCKDKNIRKTYAHRVYRKLTKKPEG